MRKRTVDVGLRRERHGPLSSGHGFIDTGHAIPPHAAASLSTFYCRPGIKEIEQDAAVTIITGHGDLQLTPTSHVR